MKALNTLLVIIISAVMMACSSGGGDSRESIGTRGDRGFNQGNQQPGGSISGQTTGSYKLGWNEQGSQQTFVDIFVSPDVASGGIPTVDEIENYVGLISGGSNGVYVEMRLTSIDGLIQAGSFLNVQIRDSYSAQDAPLNYTDYVLDGGQTTESNGMVNVIVYFYSQRFPDARLAIEGSYPLNSGQNPTFNGKIWFNNGNLGYSDSNYPTNTWYPLGNISAPVCSVFSGC